MYVLHMYLHISPLLVPFLLFPPRCLALYQIGMLAFSELRKGTPSMRLPEGVDIILSSLHVGVTSKCFSALNLSTAFYTLHSGEVCV